MLRFGKKNVELYGFMNGDLIPLEEVEDPLFAQKMLGDGFAIEPTNGDIFAPVGGKFTVVFPTLHAYGIKTQNNVEVLLHIGLETVGLDGEGFESFVKVGEKVKQGDLIGRVDLNLVKEKGCLTTSMCILTSGESIKFEDNNSNVSSQTLVATVEN